jgi:predicted transcriptional regulator
MNIKLFDSEIKLMEIIWREGDITAKEIAEHAKKEIGWGKTTTYTVIQKCIAKNAIKRIEPKFVCQALISKEEVQKFETNELINKMYNGAPSFLISALLKPENLKQEDVDYLKELIKNMD